MIVIVVLPNNRAWQGYTTIVAQLLNSGPDIEVADKRGLLHEAFKRRNHDKMKFVLDKGDMRGCCKLRELDSLKSSSVPR